MLLNYWVTSWLKFNMLLNSWVTCWFENQLVEQLLSNMLIQIQHVTQQLSNMLNWGFNLLINSWTTLGPRVDQLAAPKLINSWSTFPWLVRQNQLVWQSCSTVDQQVESPNQHVDQLLINMLNWIQNQHVDQLLINFPPQKQLVHQLLINMWVLEP